MSLHRNPIEGKTVEEIEDNFDEFFKEEDDFPC